MRKQFALFIIALVASASVHAQNRETRNVDSFSKLAFRVPGTLYLRQGNTQKVELQGDRDVLKEIETRVEGNRLVIGREGRWNNWGRDNARITVYVTVKDLDAISVSGSGDLITEGKFVTRNMDLNVSGSGALKIELDASGDVEADVSGSGNIDLTGRCRSYNSDVSGSGKVNMSMQIAERADFGVSGSGRITAKGSAESIKVSISGSGKVLAADLETNRCDVRITGSGDVEVNVKNEIDATITGSGSVSYRGNPSKVNSHASGSGRVRRM